MDSLSIKYFNEKNIAFNLTCIQACLYHALQTEMGLDQNIDELFLRDITFHIIEDSNGMLDEIGFEDSSINETVFQRHYITGGRGMETFRKIEELLDKGKCVLIQTFSSRVPFFRDYYSLDHPLTETDKDPEFIKRMHAFLAVGHDEKNLFYTENPRLIKKENFKPHPENDSIGVIDKDILKNAFDCYLNYTYIDVKKDFKLDPISVIGNVLIKCVNNHDKPSYIRNDRVVYPGKEAIDWLRRYLPSEKLDLEGPSKRYLKLSNLDFFIWMVTEIDNRRILFDILLNKNRDKLNGKFFEELQNQAKACRSSWQLLQNSLQKRRNLNIYKVDQQFISIFERVFCAEENMVEAMRKYCKKSLAISQHDS